MHGPAMYHDPMAFKPDRFLEIDGRGPEIDLHTFVFGFARRISPAGFWQTAQYGSVLQSPCQCLKISKPVENGVEVDVKPECQPGVISHPVPYKLQVAPRSAAHEELILSVEQEHPWQQGDGLELHKVRF